MSKARHWRATQNSWKKSWIMHWSKLMMQNWLRKKKIPSDWFERTNGQNNPKNSNPEEIHLFEYEATERITIWSSECRQGKCHNRNYWRTWQVASNTRRQNVVLSVGPYGDPSSAPSYVPSVNPFISPSEHQVGSLQEEMQTILEQVKVLENIITSG